VEVETWIGLFDAGIGHVLKAIAKPPTRGDIPIETDVAGELSAAAEIGISKLITADVRGTKTGLKGNRKAGAAQFEAWTNGTDERVIAMLAQPARGKINPRLHVPIGAQVPAPKIVVEECFGLSEMLAGVFGWETDASADGLKLKFLPVRS
jgi:hypothetical protein